MAMIARMTDENSRGPKSDRPPPPSGSGRSAVDDLTAGLGLVLSAARKVVQGVEPKKIEELGRRTFSRIDRQRVEALGRKAKESLDPRHIEELAEDAGRELVRVVERVAERMESILSSSGEPPKPPREPGEAGAGESRSTHEPDETAERPKVRIKDD